MPKILTFDVIVIGSGAAGFSAVEAAHAQGAKVCLIEEDRLGGECPNDACVPSKALLKAASVYRFALHARDFGVQLGSIGFNFLDVISYKDHVVQTLTGGGLFGDRYEKIFKSLGVTVKKGRAKFIDDETIEVEGEFIHAKAFVIATGTVDFVPPIIGLSTVKFLNWKQAMHMKRQPKSLAIIGGGPVGCELATFFASFGIRILLLQSAPRVLHREDEEISVLAQQALERLKIEVLTNAHVVEVVNGGPSAYGLQVDVDGNKNMHAVEQIIVAAGKIANTKGFGLETVGVRLDDRGNIITNKEQRTTASNLFAAGDVDGGFQFTHVAHHEGVVAGNNAALFAKKKRTSRAKINESVVPRCTFLEPEVASVGLTHAEVSRIHGSAIVGRHTIGSLGRALTDASRFGLLKIVAHPKTRKVLGGHMIGERAGEVMHEIALSIYLGATIDKLATMIHAYPTYSEAIAAAASSAEIEK